jgi:hypothetical protein
LKVVENSSLPSLKAEGKDLLEKKTRELGGRNTYRSGQKESKGDRAWRDGDVRDIFYRLFGDLALPFSHEKINHGPPS